MRHISIDGFAGGGGASEGLRMAGIPEGHRYPVKEQVAKIGNSVVPIMAMKIAQANL